MMPFYCDFSSFLPSVFCDPHCAIILHPFAYIILYVFTIVTMTFLFLKVFDWGKLDTGIID